MNTHLLGETAKDFSLNWRVVKRESEETWRREFREEFNTNFELDVQKALWRSVVVAHESVIESETKEKGMKTIDSAIALNTDTVEVEDMAVQTGNLLNSPRHFEIIFSFHHCLGDGLSMYAFAKTFLELCGVENFNRDLELESIELGVQPPPLIDNLVDPLMVEVLPGE